MSIRAVLISGFPGAGKTTAAEILKSVKTPFYSMGDLVRECLNKNNFEETEKNEKKIRQDLRKKRGSDIFAKATYKKIRMQKKSPKWVIVDGIRSTKEYDFFSKKFKKTVLVFIEAQLQIRYKRLIQRNKRVLTCKEISDRDKYEGKILGLDNLVKKAEFVIVNDKGILSFRKSLSKIKKIIN